MSSVRKWMPLFLTLAALGAGVFLVPEVARQIAFAVQKGQNDADRSQLAELAKNDHLSVLFRAVARAIKPAVVEVRVTKKVQFDVPDIPGLEDYFPRFSRDNTPRSRQKSETPRPKTREFSSRGLGSGVIVDAEKGYVLTNNHVVDGADQVEVVLHDQRRLKTDWVRSDPQTDLAIIKVEPDRLVAAPLGDSDKMEVGDLVLAIGAPEGLPQTVTSGIISATGRTTGNPDAYQSFLQTDAAINHGNSGGPLVNMKGEVIGINSAIVSRTGVNEGIGFAIPSNMARQVMQELIDRGKVTRGYLGVRIQTIDEKLAKDMNIPTANGALVLDAAPGSPAEKAGLKADDFITAVNGKPISNSNELRNAIASIRPGDAAELEIYRDGKKQTVKVKTNAQPENMSAAFGESRGGKDDASAGKFGLEVAALTEDLAKENGYKATVKGVLITGVKDGSDAFEQGLREGMVITQVEGKAVTTAQEFKDAVAGKEAKAGVRLKVTDRMGAPRMVFVTPGK